MDRLYDAADQRGFARLEGLTSYRTFSFADYHNPERMGFGALRVLNEEVLDKGKNIPLHAHENMEIISIPIAGALQHRDSRGANHIIVPGDVHLLSAGQGVTHWECNASADEQAHYLQLWIRPQSRGTPTRYGYGNLEGANIADRFALVAAPAESAALLELNQNAYVSVAVLHAGKSLSYKKYLRTNGVYLFLISGHLQCGSTRLNAGDGLGIKHDHVSEFFALELATVLCIEVPLST